MWPKPARRSAPSRNPTASIPPAWPRTTPCPPAAPWRWDKLWWSVLPRQVHAVRAGETLASIAEAYGTTVRRLWQNNWPLGGGAALQPGQVLVISYFDEPLGAAAFNGMPTPTLICPF